MSTPYFDFKRFRVWHDKCSMKVGTDGVLLGAWAKLSKDSSHVLDIGTGSGLIALMLAQRYEDVLVWGIDIEKNAVEQAKENALNSPFSNRINIIEKDIRLYCPHTALGQLLLFDDIVCNPPFFSEDTSPTDKGRTLARNNSSLPFDDLCATAKRLLKIGGLFHLILPYSEFPGFQYISEQNELWLARYCKVKTTETKPCKRVILTFQNSLKPSSIIGDELVLQKDGYRTASYNMLAKDFYIK